MLPLPVKPQRKVRWSLAWLGLSVHFYPLTQYFYSLIEAIFHFHPSMPPLLFAMGMALNFTILARSNKVKNASPPKPAFEENQKRHTTKFMAGLTVGLFGVGAIVNQFYGAPSLLLITLCSLGIPVSFSVSELLLSHSNANNRAEIEAELRHIKSLKTPELQ